ncbi:serine hydrolase [Leuconostocaceae bacterium ESL0958]|nr:serine hydrolase [Leuconostocaceae bacterium ESL0958]
MFWNQKKDRKRLWQWILLALLLCLVFSYLAYCAYANRSGTVKAERTIAAPALSLNLSARHAIVLDAKTGQILGEKAADQQVGIASQSKMLTAYATLRGIQEKRFNWDSLVPIPAGADWSAKDTNMFAHLEIHAGQAVPLHELFDAMFTSSANDAALALADYVKRPQQTQQQALQSWAAQLGLKGSSWYNAAGQVNEDADAYRLATAPANAENQASVRQLAVMAYQIVQQHPQIRQLYDRQGLVYHPSPDQAEIKQTEGAKVTQEIISKLNNPNQLRFEGLKTGSTPESGGALTGLIRDQQGHEFITVVSGAGDYRSQVPRYQESVDAVNQVLAARQAVNIAKGQQVTEAKAVRDLSAKKGWTSVQAQDSRTYWLPKKGQAKLSFAHPRQMNGWKQVLLRPALVAPLLDRQDQQNWQLSAKKDRQSSANVLEKVWHWLTPWH